MTELFIAYEFPDPWASRMIDVDHDFARLCQRLEDKKALVTPYGPVIYLAIADEDPQQIGTPLARWAGTAGLEPVDEPQLMVSVTHFVRRYLDEHVQRMRSRNEVDHDRGGEECPGGSGSGKGVREERGDRSVDSRKRFCPSFCDVPER